MSFWIPDLAGRPGPKYRAIVAALADDVASGALPAGAKLPPQRDLAWRLKVTVGTVARAYAEAERDGLVSGEVGRGTFVRPRPPDLTPGGALAARVEVETLIDMAHTRPSLGPVAHLLAPAFARLSHADLARSLDYDFHGCSAADRETMCAWIALEGVEAHAADLTVTVGGQHALLSAIGALTRPGEAVFAEALTYPGMKLAAAAIDRRVESLPIDAEGLIPEALEKALAARPGAVIYGMTTHHNPTTATMPVARRETIAAILRRHDGWFVEDGIYSFLAEPTPPPLWRFAPERVVYVTSLSKSLAPGFRTGFAVSPPEITARVAAAARAAATMPPAALARAAADLIGSGAALAVRDLQREETRARLGIAREYLPNDAFTAAVTPHLWIALPEPWRADAFAAEAYRRGVAVSPASAFATTRIAPEAIRVSISAPRDHAQLRRGLGLIRDLLRTPPPLAGVTV